VKHLVADEETLRSAQGDSKKRMMGIY